MSTDQISRNVTMSTVNVVTFTTPRNNIKGDKCDHVKPWHDVKNFLKFLIFDLLTCQQLTCQELTYQELFINFALHCMAIWWSQKYFSFGLICACSNRVTVRTDFAIFEGWLLFVDFTLACWQPNVVNNRKILINRCPLPCPWTAPPPVEEKSQDLEYGTVYLNLISFCHSSLYTGCPKKNGPKF